MKANKSALFLVAILAMIAVFVVVLIVELRTDPIAESISGGSLINTLFIVEKDGAPFSSNIIAYYPANKRGAMFDIPPETGLIIRSLSRTATVESLYRERGVEAFRREVESLAGTSIPFYAVISFDGLAMLADLLSGLNVFIPTPVDVYMPPENVDAPPSLEERVLLPSGSVTLDGDKLRLYMTYTSDDDTEDAATLRRQHAVMAFLRALNDNASFAFSRDVFPIISSCFASNVSGSSFKTLLTAISQIDVERLSPRQMRGSVRLVDGEEMLFPFYDGDLFKQTINQTFSSFLSENSDEFERIYALEVLNGTATQGLARRTAELYQGFGYDVVRVANAPSSDYEETLIIDRIGSSTVAAAVAQAIQCGNIETAPVDDESAASATEYSVDFTIILGSDFNGRYVTPSRR